MKLTLWLNNGPEGWLPIEAKNEAHLLDMIQGSGIVNGQEFRATRDVEIAVVGAGGLEEEAERITEAVALKVGQHLRGHKPSVEDVIKMALWLALDMGKVVAVPAEED